MRLNFSYILALMVIVLTSSAGNRLYAQEEDSPMHEIPELNPNSPDPTLQEEKPLLYEPDTKAANPREQTITPQSKSKTKGTEPSKTSKTEEDALSFNFLYYIIQKFKISDIVEQ